MWSTKTLWFDIAMVMSIFAVGNVLLGHFEEHKPKYQRLLKLALVLGLTVVLFAFGLRRIAYSLIGLLLVGAAYVHMIWLPRHGVNGWTGEPKERYYELLKVTAKRKAEAEPPVSHRPAQG